MLISRGFEIGFAHYPKTAGTSLQRWFIETCPDAELLLPENPHYPVALRLRRLRPNTAQRQFRRFTRRALALLSPKLEPSLADNTDPFIRCARHHTFRDFVVAAVIGGRIATYEKFFDVGGPLWHNTTLLDFESLELAVQSFCADHGLGHARPLQWLNRSQGGRDIQPYVDEIGPLMGDVRRHFRWYYEEGVHLMLRGRLPLRTAA